VVCCSDPRNHMPFGVAGEEVVHLAAPDAALFQIADGAKAVLRDLIKACLSAIIRATYCLHGRKTLFRVASSSDHS
jgi:hypothetical protein